MICVLKKSECNNYLTETETDIRRKKLLLHDIE